MQSIHPRQSLEQMVESLPLLSDLHVHLLGSGDINFWQEQMLKSPNIVVENDILKKAGIDCFNSMTRKHVVLGDIAEREDVLKKALEMDKPQPGNFDKAFSPLFTLRRFLATKDPEVLSELILWNSKRYQLSGVHYVEFSVGGNWIKEPYINAIINGIIDAEKEHEVLVRILIAFNRSNISDKIHNSTYLKSLVNQGDKKLCHTRERKHYEDHLKKLSLCKSFIESSYSAEKFIVGFDIVGNEENRPYTPFLLPDFLSFASEMKRKNKNFGFRLHLGEGITADNDIGYVSLRLGEHFISTLSKAHRFRVRSGHGIGLLGLRGVAYSKWKDLYPRMRKEAANRIKENLSIAPIEINLTSNNYLAKTFTCFSEKGRSLRSHVMGELLKEGFRLVLGTDDPGIFPDISIRGEFKKAIKKGLITDIENFKNIVNESVCANFADEETLKKLSNIISSHYPGIIIPINKPEIPEDTPLKEPSDDLDINLKQAEYEKAIEDLKSVSGRSIEEWFNKWDPP